MKLKIRLLQILNKLMICNVLKLTKEYRDTGTTGLFNDFSHMLIAYDDVMKRSKVRR